ncbi:hypothetical protein SO802_012257 [Lithocarpus litseifolius]|uniref:Uncharacterized protein n=1 Tax=Lithocarpus litseifolius TaxID=425828 RepID=A0AAW2D665_9ROSI
MENENAEPKFKRIPFVGQDGCHLKGRCSGQLLSITTKDGNDNIFPVAMVMVKQEIKDS